MVTDEAKVNVLCFDKIPLLNSEVVCDDPNVEVLCFDNIPHFDSEVVLEQNFGDTMESLEYPLL